MKKITFWIVAAALVLSACSKENNRTEPVDKEALLVGTWQSSHVSVSITVNGITPPSQPLPSDSSLTSLYLTFTEDFNYYGLDTLTMLDGYDLTDTARYNLEGDSLFLIKQALAYDTLLVKDITEAELGLIIDNFEQSIAGQILIRQTVLNFTKVE